MLFLLLLILLQVHQILIFIKFLIEKWFSWQKILLKLKKPHLPNIPHQNEAINRIANQVLLHFFLKNHLWLKWSRASHLSNNKLKKKRKKTFPKLRARIITKPKTKLITKKRIKPMTGLRAGLRIGLIARSRKK